MKKYKKISTLELFREKNNLSQQQTAELTGFSLRTITRVESCDYEMSRAMSKIIDIYTIITVAQSAIDDIIKLGDAVKYKRVNPHDVLKICFSRIECVLDTKYANKKITAERQVGRVK